MIFKLIYVMLSLAHAGLHWKNECVHTVQTMFRCAPVTVLRARMGGPPGARFPTAG